MRNLVGIDLSNLPAEVDWDAVPAGEDLLVRGMGLNFFDGMAQLTLGRGGRFVDTGDGPGNALRYEPSGREPVMHPASRRGVCYLPKAELETFVPHAVSLKYLVPAEVRRLQVEHGTLDFMVHLWPLIHRDVVRAYRLMVERAQPGEVYNLCSGRDVSIQEVADHLAAGSRRAAGGSSHPCARDTARRARGPP